MGQIGYFGNERFIVSDNKKYTFKEFKRTTAGRFSSFDRIGKKPMTNFDGPGLDTVSFSIKADIFLGVMPRAVLDHWCDLADAGTVDVLVIGGKAVGHNKWLLKSADEAWETIDGKGGVITSTINLSFEEYVEK